MSGAPASDTPQEKIHVVWHEGAVPRSARNGARTNRGAVVWFTGLSGSGKSTIAAEVEKQLVDEGRAAYLLDGDNLRHGLNSGLGFSAEDREENVRRVGEVAALFADAGLVALVPLVSPYRSGRDRARHRVESVGLPFVEVYVATPLAECEARDTKGLYAMARAGELHGLTGVDDPYEEPIDPELRVNAESETIVVSVARVMDTLRSRLS